LNQIDKNEDLFEQKTQIGTYLTKVDKH